MTWGEIQKSALEKMFAKDEPIKLDKISKLKNDDDCKWYLSAMPAVANEAIRRIKPYVMNTFKLNEETGEYEKTTVPKIDEDIDEDTEIDLPESACVLIPLYIASQLYKDDDIAQATAYRNEFETGLQDLIYEIENQDTIREVY